jgi:hypothetical protein
MVETGHNGAMFHKLGTRKIGGPERPFLNSRTISHPPIDLGCARLACPHRVVRFQS